jgi:UDP-GlcNAc:undecaprenyl-phosphate/decaprenyl-phosphate GlcNAc-1-phosphate transferase
VSGRTSHRRGPGRLWPGRPGSSAASLATGALAAGLARAEGPALALAAIAAPAVNRGLSPRLRAALAVAGAGAAGFGGYDDLAGDGDRRGFRGHLGALAQGEITTGAVKLGGIGATGLVAAAALGGGPADIAINAGLVAGGANLLNLFDLRPGRALKVALASGALLAAAGSAGAGPAGASAKRGGGESRVGAGAERGRARSAGAGRTERAGGTGAAVWAPLGAALALLGEDLGERAMLGDAGANALGALLGVAAAASLPRPARVALLAGIAGLTAASEKVSFTAVIERTPALRWLDMLGRRPVPAAPVPGRPPGTQPAGAPESGHTAAAATLAPAPPPRPSP